MTLSSTYLSEITAKLFVREQEKAKAMTMTRMEIAYAHIAHPAVQVLPQLILET
jgi:hypothetical protein